MGHFGSVFFFFTFLVALIAMVCSVDANMRQLKAQQVAECLNTSQPDPYEELAKVRKDLKRALSLLEESFGSPVNLDSIKSTPVTITAYSSTKDQCDSTPHITASNSPVRIGIVAISNDLMNEMGLSFGQRVLIPGHGLFEVQDKMNSKWHRRVDIWHDDREAARLFGKQKGTLLWIKNEREKA
jgi:3D (Asp-Asp-Asp) domain-containing protein